jgi:hypothetical protein
MLLLLILLYYYYYCYYTRHTAPAPPQPSVRCAPLYKNVGQHWCGMFKDGWTNVHDEERSGRPSVVSDDVHSVDQKSCERRRFTVSELSYEFPHISRTVLYEIIADRLGCHKFCARRDPKMLTDAHKTHTSSAQDGIRKCSLMRTKRREWLQLRLFSERYHKDGDRFLDHIVTGDETWVLIVNVETRERSQPWIDTHSPNKPKKAVNKRAWAQWRQTSLTQTYKNLFPDMTSASVQADTTLRRGLSMYLFFVYNKIVLSLFF